MATTQLPNPGLTGTTAQQNAKQQNAAVQAPAGKKQPGFSFATTTLVELLGITLLTIFAGMSDDFGKVAVILMWGFILGWALMNSTDLANMVKAI